MEHLVLSNHTVAPFMIFQICDFGSSKIREQGAGKSVNTTTNILGTIRWMAPEVRNGTIVLTGDQ